MLAAATAGVGVPIFGARAASAAQRARGRKIGGTAILDERRRPICFGRCSCVWKRRSRPRARDEGRTGQAPRRHAGPPLRPCAGVTAGTPPILKGRLAGLVERRRTVRDNAAKLALPPRQRRRKAQRQLEPILGRTGGAVGLRQSRSRVQRMSPLSDPALALCSSDGRLAVRH